MLIEPGLEGSTGFRLLGLVSTCAAGISSHASPPMVSSLTKKGQSPARIERDSFASADEIGTGDDFMTAVATSDAGRARRLRPLGVRAEPVAGVEKSLNNEPITREQEQWETKTHIQTLSATPPRRPSKQRRLISSCPSLSI